MLRTKTLIFLLIIPCLQRSAQSVTIKFTNIVCDFNEKYFDKDWTCQLKSVNKIPTITIKATTTKEIENGYVNVNVQRNADGTWATMFNSTQDGCELFEGKKINPVLNMAYDWIKGNIHGEVSCPFKGTIDIQNAAPPLRGVLMFPGNYLTHVKVYRESPLETYLSVKIYSRQ